jgi:hypothetical protein
MRRIALFFALLLLGTAWAAAEEEAVLRVYTLKHVPVAEIFQYIQPLLSSTGDLRVMSGRNMLQIKDTSERQKLVEQVIATLDRPPDSYRIAVKVLEASQGEPPAGQIRNEILGIGQQLRRVMPYSNYASIEKLVIEGTPGDQISYRLGKDYQIDFLIRRVLQHPQMIQLSGLRLSRVRTGADGQERFHLLLRTSINLTLAQIHVLGASSSDKGGKALVLVFQAERK